MNVGIDVSHTTRSAEVDIAVNGDSFGIGEDASGVVVCQVKAGEQAVLSHGGGRRIVSTARAKRGDMNLLFWYELYKIQPCDEPV